MFPNHYIIIDDFYPDPYRVRDLALHLPHGEPGSGNYAGRMTGAPWFTPEHRDMLQKITNEPVEAAPGLNGYFRFTMQHDTWKQHIHFDPKPGQIWAGLVYLSPPDTLNQHESTLRCGTTFWRHNRTGLDRIPVHAHVLEKYGWYSDADLKVFLDTEGMDESLWTETLYMPAKFNRLILFRPWLFHSPGRAFGDTVENCRLIQLFFLRLQHNDPPQEQ